MVASHGSVRCRRCSVGQSRRGSCVRQGGEPTRRENQSLADVCPDSIVASYMVYVVDSAQHLRVSRNGDKKKRGHIALACRLVRMGGLEPPRLSPPDPKSGAATITPHPLFLGAQKYKKSRYMLSFNLRPVQSLLDETLFVDFVPGHSINDVRAGGKTAHTDRIASGFEFEGFDHLASGIKHGSF